MSGRIEVECYDRDEFQEGHNPQAKFLVRGWDDVLWTNDIEAAVQYVRQCLEQERGK